MPGLAVSLLCLSLALPILYRALADTTDPVSNLAIGSLTAVVPWVYVVLRAGRNLALGYFHPAVVVPGYFIVTVSLGAWVLWGYSYLPWEAHPEFGLSYLRIRDGIPNAAIVAGFGILALIAGCLIIPERRVERQDSVPTSIDWNATRSVFNYFGPLTVLLSIALSAGAVPISIRHYANLTKDFGMLGLFFVGADIALANRCSIQPWAGYISSVAGTIILTAMRDGQRGPVLRALLLFALGFGIVRHSQSKKIPWFGIAVVASLVVFLLPFLTLLKESVSTGEDFGVAFTQARMTNNDLSMRERVEDVMQVIGIRVLYIPAHLSLYMSQWPSVYPFENGATMWWSIQDLLPRLAAPDKENMMVKFNRLAVGAGILSGDDVSGEGTSAAPDALSEYYINFGVTGVVLGCFASGVYFRLLFNQLVVKRRTLFTFAVYIYLSILTFPDTSVVRRISSDYRILCVWFALFFFGCSIFGTRRRLTHSTRYPGRLQGDCSSVKVISDGHLS